VDCDFIVVYHTSLISSIVLGALDEGCIVYRESSRGEVSPKEKVRLRKQLLGFALAEDTERKPVTSRTSSGSEPLKVRELLCFAGFLFI